MWMLFSIQTIGFDYGSHLETEMDTEMNESNLILMSKVSMFRATSHNNIVYI